MSVSRETALGADVPRETRLRLEGYADLLRRWQARINLVSQKSLNDLWRRHFGDSLQLARYMPQTDRAVDLGSGGGFPGLVLAIATGVCFDLVESDQRKAAFLVEAARLTGAPVRVHAMRAENVDIPPVPLVTARGFLPLPELLAHAVERLAPGGVCLLLKGRRVAEEIAAASASGWQMRAETFDSVTGDGVVLRVSEIHRE